MQIGFFLQHTSICSYSGKFFLVLITKYDDCVIVMLRSSKQRKREVVQQSVQPGLVGCNYSSQLIIYKKGRKSPSGGHERVIDNWVCPGKESGSSSRSPSACSLFTALSKVLKFPVLQPQNKESPAERRSD